jgi:signal transduction histidine kinase
MERNINEIQIIELRIDELIWEVRHELLKNFPYYSVSVNFLSTPEDELNLVFEGNAQLISTAFHNLIENACKFSDDNQCIVEIGFNENEIIFRCSDHGIGIDSKELELLFQPFYRSVAARQFQGHGLGLSMVDRIVRLHNGNISVNSSPSTGTTFQLLVPKKFYKF